MDTQSCIWKSNCFLFFSHPLSVRLKMGPKSKNRVRECKKNDTKDGIMGVWNELRLKFFYLQLVLNNTLLKMWCQLDLWLLIFDPGPIFAPQKTKIEQLLRTERPFDFSWFEYPNRWILSSKNIYFYRFRQSSVNWGKLGDQKYKLWVRPVVEKLGFFKIHFVAVVNLWGILLFKVSALFYHYHLSHCPKTSPKIAKLGHETKKVGVSER